MKTAPLALEKVVGVGDGAICDHKQRADVEHRASHRDFVDDGRVRLEEQRSARRRVIRAHTRSRTQDVAGRPVSVKELQVADERIALGEIDSHKVARTAVTDLADHAPHGGCFAVCLSFVVVRRSSLVVANNAVAADEQSEHEYDGERKSEREYDGRKTKKKKQSFN